LGTELLALAAVNVSDILLGGLIGFAVGPA